MRDKFRPGDNLVEDEVSGLTIWASDAVRSWDGVVTHRDWQDFRHPQTLVPLIPRTENPVIARASPLVTAFVCASSFGTVIAGSSVTAPWGPASHLFTQT